MKIDYIPLYTEIIYRGEKYKTDTACSRSSGTIRIIGDGPHSGFFVSVSDLQEISSLNPKASIANSNNFSSTGNGNLTNNSQPDSQLS